MDEQGLANAGQQDDAEGRDVDQAELGVLTWRSTIRTRAPEQGDEWQRAMDDVVARDATRLRPAGSPTRQPAPPIPRRAIPIEKT